MGYTVQVKRLRHEDPLDALVFQGSKRKASSDDAGDSASLVFRLVQTVDEQQPGNDFVFQESPNSEEKMLHLASSSNKRRKKAAHDPPAKEAAVETVAPELQSMINEYLEKQKETSPPVERDEVDIETEDYVYDVYFSEKNDEGALTETRVGYIQLSESEEKLFFDEGSDGEQDFLNEDDDSNAEDHYKNDYPDEEDQDEKVANEFSDCESGSDAEALNSMLDRLDLQLEEWSEENESDATYARYGWR